MLTCSGNMSKRILREKVFPGNVDETPPYHCSKGSSWRILQGHGSLCMTLHRCYHSSVAWYSRRSSQCQQEVCSSRRPCTLPIGDWLPGTMEMRHNVLCSGAGQVQASAMPSPWLSSNRSKHSSGHTEPQPRGSGAGLPVPQPEQMVCS